MRLITTHINADFDGLAAMVAAQKIYPDAVMAFSGSQEKNVRDFIAQSLLYAYDFAKIKDIDLQAVDTLILVDTRSSERIGPFKECLDKSRDKAPSLRSPSAKQRRSPGRSRSHRGLRLYHDPAGQHSQRTTHCISAQTKRPYLLSAYMKIPALSPISPPLRKI